MDGICRVCGMIGDHHFGDVRFFFGMGDLKPRHLTKFLGLQKFSCLRVVPNKVEIEFVLFPLDLGWFFGALWRGHIQRGQSVGGNITVHGDGAPRDRLGVDLLGGAFCQSRIIGDTRRDRIGSEIFVKIDGGKKSLPSHAQDVSMKEGS